LGGSSGELQTSSVLLGVAAFLLGLVWLMAVAGDPTDGIAFFTFAFTIPVLVGVALVLAAARRRDLFGNLGLAGAIGVLVAALGLGVVGFVVGVLGLAAIAVAVARKDIRLLAGLVLIALGTVGLIVHDDPLGVFLPFIAIGSAVLALTLRRVSG
jgi:hypothetical protein